MFSYIQFNITSGIFTTGETRRSVEDKARRESKHTLPIIFLIFMRYFALKSLRSGKKSQELVSVCRRLSKFGQSDDNWRRYNGQNN